MPMPRTHPKRLPYERQPMPRTKKNHEQSSAIVQRSIHEAGGLIPVIFRIAGGCPSRADAGRLVGLQMTLATARTDLEALDLSERGLPHAGSLRQTISSTISEMNALTAQVDSERQYAARVCLMAAAAGEPAALTELAQHAGRVSPDFEAAIIAANT
jgi:hypothetical protein